MKWLKNLLQKLGHQVSDEDFAQIEADALAAQAAEEQDADPPRSEETPPPQEPPSPPAEPEPELPPADDGVQRQLAALKAENDALKLDKALTAFLSGKVKDPEAVKPMLMAGGLKLKDDGTVEALEETFAGIQAAAAALQPEPADRFEGAEPPASEPPPPKALTMSEAIAEKIGEQLA